MDYNTNQNYDNSNYSNLNNINQSYNNQYNINQNNITNKKNNTGMILLIVIIVIIVGLAALGFYLIRSGELLYGKWVCNNTTIVELNKNKTFRMYVDETHDVNGTFTIKDKAQNGTEIKYTLLLESKSIVLDGKKQEYNKTNTYNVTMNSKNIKSLSMINPDTNSIYSCTKK